VKSQGFSLVEVLVAITVLACALGSLAGLGAISTDVNRRARDATLAVELAGQKMEELWGHVDLGPSPGDSLGRNTQHYCDFLDARGLIVAAGTVPPVTTMYVRRWSVTSLPGGSAGAVVLQVAVRLAAGRSGGVTLVSVKTRSAG
jgi:prepilin-type N-terminal cleavage/methylation domain-containing protein